MTSTATMPSVAGRNAPPSPPSVAEARTDRVWGHSHTGLHDRHWASKRIQVVRLGCGSVASHGPAMFLLTEPDDLVLFELSPVMKLFNRVKPRAMRIRVRDDHTQQYAETVISDADGRFIAIRRDYRARTRSTARVWLTPERAIADMWAKATDLTAVRLAIRKTAGRQRVASLPCKGRVFDAVAEGTSLTTALVQRWRDPGVLIDDVYEFQQGVWLHEGVHVPEDARFVGPLWIGAGATISPGEVVIGPLAITDAAGVHPPVGAVSWETLSIPGYRLLPRMPRRRLGRVAKRIFDVVFSLLVLGLTAPLYPLLILAIFLEDGWPPFFAHTRQTIHGRSFPCYKFRTMCRNAEKLKTLIAGNVCDGPQFYMANDPRLLKVGKWLRRFQLDELPQFYNVLVGHMSVVGPRPSPDKENQFCPAWREARLSVRPGITGLWQVRRTREPQTDFQEWIRYDLEYVQHASWRLDLWIIMLTIKKVLGG